MINNHLITPEDVHALSRNSSAQLDPRDVYTYIEEAEQLDIKPAIGAALYMRLLNNSGDAQANQTLLYGGSYNTCCGSMAVFAGIRKALAYYVYGRIVKNGGRTATRFGFVEKRDEYSYQVDYKERLNIANDATLVADSYMKETLNYISTSNAFPEYRSCESGMRNRRVTLKAIGQ